VLILDALFRFRSPSDSPPEISSKIYAGLQPAEYDRIQAPALGIFNKITHQYRLPYYWYLDLKLVFPFNTKDGTAYQVNHIKEHEWKAAITELRKAGWRRSKKFQAAKRSAVWAMSLIVASFLGALFAETSKDFYKNQVRPRVFKTSHVEKLKENNKRACLDPADQKPGSM
jgi:hypothetical protein